MFSITSTQNPKIKYAISLHEAKSRKKEGLYLIEGERELTRYLEALKANRVGPALAGTLVSTFIHHEALSSEMAALLNASNNCLGDCFAVNEAVIAKLSFRQSPSSVIAIARQIYVDLLKIDVPSKARFVIAQGVEKPGNLGALWRVADAVEARAVILCGAATDIWNPAVIRSSMGSFFHIPACMADGEDILNWARTHEIQLVAATPEAQTLYYDLPIKARCALVLGSEDEGLDVFWRSAIEDHKIEGVRLPMLGAADSLNVSCAGSVLLYDILRRQMYE